MPASGVLFMNPRAGTATPVVEALRREAESRGLHPLDISPDLDVQGIVREHLSRGVRKFVVAGGDGSVHHVAQALVHTEGILGIIPAGSVNHLARDLRLPLDWRSALDVAMTGSIRQIDAGRIDDRYFFNTAMLGIAPMVTEYRERFRSVHGRARAYFKAARLALHRFPHVTLVVEIDGRLETLRTQLFVVGVNSYDLTQVGPISTRTSFDDGKLTIYSLSFMSRLQFVRATARYLRGRITETPGFRRIRTTHLRVDSGHHHLRVSVDGELRISPPPLRLSAVPAALLVRVPGE